MDSPYTICNLVRVCLDAMDSRGGVFLWQDRQIPTWQVFLAVWRLWAGSGQMRLSKAVAQNTDLTLKFSGPASVAGAGPLQ